MHLLSLSLAQSAAKIPNNLWALLIPLAILEILLLVFALIDVIRRRPEQIRGSKLAWILVILLISTFGPICYFVVGRKEAEDGHL